MSVLGRYPIKRGAGGLSQDASRSAGGDFSHARTCGKRRPDDPADLVILDEESVMAVRRADVRTHRRRQQVVQLVGQPGRVEPVGVDRCCFYWALIDFISKSQPSLRSFYVLMISNTSL